MAVRTDSEPSRSISSPVSFIGYDTMPSPHPSWRGASIQADKAGPSATRYRCQNHDGEVTLSIVCRVERAEKDQQSTCTAWMGRMIRRRKNNQRSLTEVLWSLKGERQSRKRGSRIEKSYKTLSGSEKSSCLFAFNLMAVLVTFFWI